MRSDTSGLSRWAMNEIWLEEVASFYLLDISDVNMFLWNMSAGHFLLSTSEMCSSFFLISLQVRCVHVFLLIYPRVRCFHASFWSIYIWGVFMFPVDLSTNEMCSFSQMIYIQMRHVQVSRWSMYKRHMFKFLIDLSRSEMCSCIQVTYVEVRYVNVSSRSIYKREPCLCFPSIYTSHWNEHLSCYFQQ